VCVFGARKSGRAHVGDDAAQEGRGGGGGCVSPTHIAGRTALVGASRPSSCLLSFRSCLKGGVIGRSDRDCRWTRLTESNAEFSPRWLDSLQTGNESARCVIVEHLHPPDRGTRVDPR